MRPDVPARHDARRHARAEESALEGERRALLVDTRRLPAHLFLALAER